MSRERLPQWHMESHLDAALLEDVEFLRQRGGLQDEQIARRLGLTLNTMQIKLKRAQERAGKVEA